MVAYAPTKNMIGHAKIDSSATLIYLSIHYSYYYSFYFILSTHVGTAVYLLCFILLLGLSSLPCVSSTFL